MYMMHFNLMQRARQCDIDLNPFVQFAEISNMLAIIDVANIIHVFLNMTQILSTLQTTQVKKCSQPTACNTGTALLAFFLF